MGYVLFNIVLSVAMLVAFISGVLFLTSFFVTGLTGRSQKRTQAAVGDDPQNPEDRFIGKTAHSWKRIRKRALILTLIFGLPGLCLLSRSRPAQPLPHPAMTTIGQLCGELSALAEKTPTSLTYAESIGAPETLVVTVDDPAVAREALRILLSARVSRLGCQLDMCQLRYEDYRFVFGEDTFTLSFVPASYFCYGGQYYELGENRLSSLCSFLHESVDSSGSSDTEATETAAEPQSKWYSEDAVLETDFVDNGDEARSLTELTLSADEECLTGVIEGAYDVLSIDKQPDGYVIRYTYGDFYSHEKTRSSRVTVENGEMVITDMAQ